MLNCTGDPFKYMFLKCLSSKFFFFNGNSWSDSEMYKRQTVTGFYLEKEPSDEMRKASNLIDKK